MFDIRVLVLDIGQVAVMIVVQGGWPFGIRREGWGSTTAVRRAHQPCYRL